MVFASQQQPAPSRSRSQSRSRRREQHLTKSMQLAQQQHQEAAATAAQKKDANRRNMGFVNYSEQRQKRSSTSMSRTREHAKQIAMALSQDTQYLNTMQSSSFADFGSAFGSSTANPFAVAAVNEEMNDDFFAMDAFSPEVKMKHERRIVNKNWREGSSSTPDQQQQSLKPAALQLRKTKSTPRKQLQQQKPVTRSSVVNQDVFSDPGGGSNNDWPPVVRVSAVAASPSMIT